MKYFIIVLCIFLFTSCGWFNFGTHYDYTASFMFFDEHGNDLFADSLDLTDFHLTSIRGSAEIAHINNIEGVTAIEIYLIPDDGGMEALFHFKDDVDTITARYTKHEREIRSVVYNGVLFKTQSSTGELYHITK
mgnify:CR=1